MSSGTFNQAVDRTLQILRGGDIAMDEAVDQACKELGGGFAPERIKTAATDAWSEEARKAAAEARAKGTGGGNSSKGGKNSSLESQHRSIMKQVKHAETSGASKEEIHKLMDKANEIKSQFKY